MASGLVGSLGGMSPEQAQSMTKLAVQSMLEQQKQRATSDYRSQRLGLESRKLDFYKDRETRLREEAKAEQEMEVRKFNNEKKLNAIKSMLKAKQIQKEDARFKLLSEKANKLKEEQKTLDSLNTKLKIPGTEEDITAGAAVRAGIFDDIVDNTADLASKGEFAEWEGLGPKLKSYLYLTQKEGISKKDALGKVFGRDVEMSDFIRLLELLQLNKIKEVRKMIGEFKNLDEPSYIDKSDSGTTANLPPINIDVSKNPLE